MASAMRSFKVLGVGALVGTGLFLTGHWFLSALVGAGAYAYLKTVK